MLRHSMLYAKNISVILKRHSLFLRIVAVIALFWVVFRTIHMDDIFLSFRKARIEYLVVALFLMIPNILLQIMKWRFILRDILPPPSMKEVTASLFGGFFIGAATPGRTGEFARGVFMHNRSFLQTASMTVVDKGFNQITVIITGLAALSFLLPEQYAAIPFAIDCGILIGLLNLHKLKPSLEKIITKHSHSDRARDALVAFDTLKRNTVVGMTIYSVCFFAVYSIQYYIMLLAFTEIPPIIALKTLPIVYLVNLLLPISFGDFGIKELTALHLLTRFNIDNGAIFSATLLNNVVTFLAPGIIGGIMILLLRYSPDQEELSSIPDKDRTPVR